MPENGPKYHIHSHKGHTFFRNLDEVQPLHRSSPFQADCSARGWSTWSLCNIRANDIAFTIHLLVHACTAHTGLVFNSVTVVTTQAQLGSKLVDVPVTLKLFGTMPNDTVVHSPHTQNHRRQAALMHISLRLIYSIFCVTKLRLQLLHTSAVLTRVYTVICYKIFSAS